MYAHFFIRKCEVNEIITMTLNCLVRVLLRNIISHIYFHVVFRGGRQGNVVIFVEFPTQHWHYDPMLNATMVTAHAMIMVYIFYDQFGASMMSPFFSPHNPYDASPCLLCIPFFIPPFTCQMQRQILTCAWHRHIPSSVILQDSPICL